MCVLPFPVDCELSVGTRVIHLRSSPRSCALEARRCVGLECDPPRKGAQGSRATVLQVLSAQQSCRRIVVVIVEVNLVRSPRKHLVRHSINMSAAALNLMAGSTGRHQHCGFPAGVTPSPPLISQRQDAQASRAEPGPAGGGRFFKGRPLAALRTGQRSRPRKVTQSFGLTWAERRHPRRLWECVGR